MHKTAENFVTDYARDSAKIAVVTPVHFLDLIYQFKALVAEKQKLSYQQFDRLNSGILTLK